ncbi:MAG: preprotein translocase subunit SecG [Alistipes sp.]|nr:preprotein translocase subunit SecG [Alistipes sp.]MBQ4127512.1 preprotein translocase subunit SecG [Alistipes sp.]
MLYSICIGLILVASIILILAILVQNPKSGMAANFGAANQVMGVRESANILEKTTWTLSCLILVLSLVATVAMDADMSSNSTSSLQKDAEALIEKVNTNAATEAMPQAVIPAENAEQKAE